jgi:hypothetical protein
MPQGDPVSRRKTFANDPAAVLGGASASKPGKLFLVLFRPTAEPKNSVEHERMGAFLTYARDAAKAGHLAEVGTYSPEGSALAAIELGAETGLALVAEKIPVLFDLKFPFDPSQFT